MKRVPTIKTAMTPFPYSIDIGAPILAAQSFMREHAIRHLPVTDHGTLIGLVTDRDIKLMLGPDFDYPNPRELTVSDAMVAEAYVADVDTPLEVVLDHMAEKRLGSSLVTRKSKLVGVFTSVDACRVLAEYLRRAAPEGSETPGAVE